MRRTLFALTAALTLSACAFLGFGEPEIAGEYQVEAMVDGQPSPAMISIVKEEMGYGGRIDSEMAGFTIQSVEKMDAGGWLIRASGPQGSLEMRMTLEDGGRVSGTWSLGGAMGGEFSGERIEG